MNIAIALLLTTVDPTWHPDTIVICGRNPQQECLKVVEKCLQEGIKEGIDEDEVFEKCVETTPPWLING
jgi:hypothetical protein